jgi:hypothetical protein
MDKKTENFVRRQSLTVFEVLCKIDGSVSGWFSPGKHLSSLQLRSGFGGLVCYVPFCALEIPVAFDGRKLLVFERVCMPYT